jgi:hypothetical protein
METLVRLQVDVPAGSGLSRCGVPEGGVHGITMKLCGGGYCYLTETAREVLPFDSEHQPAVRSSDGL